MSSVFTAGIKVYPPVQIKFLKSVDDDDNDE
jgi:hypothetical protein